MSSQPEQRMLALKNIARTFLDGYRYFLQKGITYWFEADDIAGFWATIEFSERVNGIDRITFGGDGERALLHTYAKYPGVLYPTTVAADILVDEGNFRQALLNCLGNLEARVADEILTAAEMKTMAERYLRGKSYAENPGCVFQDVDGNIFRIWFKPSLNGVRYVAVIGYDGTSGKQAYISAFNEDQKCVGTPERIVTRESFLRQLGECIGFSDSALNEKIHLQMMRIIEMLESRIDAQIAGSLKKNLTTWPI